MKRILLVIAAIAAVATAAVWFAAQESYVTTVSATVGTSLNVSAHGTQDYGLLFGQEVRFGAMHAEISEKAAADANLTGVNINIGCNDGPTAANQSSICGNLVFSPAGTAKLVPGEPVNIQWTFTAPDCEGAAQKKSNPKVVGCTQDKNWFLSGDVFIDVTGYQGSIKEDICDKKTGGLVNGTTGAPILFDHDNDPTTAPIQVPC